MIFLTVGTHEQPFDRLIKAIDEFVEEGVIQQVVFMQIGYATYFPKNCEWKKFISPQEMTEFIEKADIVITHGAPASFLPVVTRKKVPIVVPRFKKFNEHVNNHQLEFSSAVDRKFNNIILIEDIKQLKEAILNFNTIAETKNRDAFNNNHQFMAKFTQEIQSWCRDEKNDEDS